MWGIYGKLWEVQCKSQVGYVKEYSGRTTYKKSFVNLDCHSKVKYMLFCKEKGVSFLLFSLKKSYLNGLSEEKEGMSGFLFRKTHTVT